MLPPVWLKLSLTVRLPVPASDPLAIVNCAVVSWLLMVNTLAALPARLSDPALVSVASVVLTRLPPAS